MSKLIRNTSIYTIGNILPKAINFIFVPIYSYYLTPEDYGITASMGVITMILAIVFTLGVERSLNRLYFDYKTEKDKKNFLGTITIVIYLIAITVTALLFIIHPIVNKIFKTIAFFPFYQLAILTALVNVLATVPSMYFRITEKPKAFLLINFSQFVVSLIFILLLVVYYQQGALGKMRAGMYATLIVFPIYFIVNLKIINFKFDIKILKEALKFSLPMLPVMLSTWVLNLSNRIFIDRYFSQAEVGLYSMGNNIAGFVLLVSSSFYMAYSPHFYKTVNTNDKIIAKKILRKTNSIFLVGLMFICFVITFYAKEVVYILLDSRYHSSYIFVPLISLAYFFQQANGLVHLYIYQHKKTQVVMWIIISAALLNIGLNYIFISRLGALGAAWATLISFMYQFTLGYQYSKKFYFIPFNWVLLIPLLISGISLYLLFEFVFDLTPIISVLIKSAIIFSFIVLLWIRFHKQLNPVLIKIFRK